MHKQQQGQQHPKDSGGNATIACKRSKTGIATVAHARTLFAPQYLTCRDCSQRCQK